MARCTDQWRLSGTLPTVGIQHVVSPKILLESLESLCAAMAHAARLDVAPSIVPSPRTPSIFASMVGLDRVRRIISRYSDSTVDALKDVELPMDASVASLSASDRLLIAIASYAGDRGAIIFDGSLIDFRGAVRVCKLLQRLRPDRLTIWVSSAEQPYPDDFDSISCLRSPLRLFA